MDGRAGDAVATSTGSHHGAVAAETAGSDPRRWIGLAVTLTATFMVLLDVTIVNVAIPAIQHDLHASFAQVQFVLAAYLLAYGTVLITGGRLGDIFGRKRLFIIGVLGFTTASALCGLAPTPAALIAARALQGFMAGLMYPQVLSVIQVSFAGHERGTAMGILGSVIGIAAVSGPLLGGVLIHADLLGLDWRPIFLVNVPIGVLAVVGASLLLSESRSPSAPGLDILGMVIASAALLLLTYPLVQGRDAGWPAWAWECLGGSGVALVAFVVYELQRDRRQRSALVSMRMFTDRGFTVGILLTVCLLAGVPAFVFTLSLFLQIGLSFDALRAGLVLAPFPVGMAIASRFSIKLAPRLGKRLLALGALMLCAGMAGVFITLQVVGASLTGYELIPALLVSGSGLGFVLAPLITIVLAGIAHGNAGAASGVLTTAHQVGSALGIAIVGVVFFGVLAGHADSVSHDAAPLLGSRLAAANVPAERRAQLVTAFDRCFHDRASASDPTVTPPSCSPPAGSGISRLSGILADQGARDRSVDFTYSLQRALFYELTVFALVFVLVLFLPRPPGALRRGAGPVTAASAEPSASPAPVPLPALAALPELAPSPALGSAPAPGPPPALDPSPTLGSAPAPTPAAASPREVTAMPVTRRVAAVAVPLVAAAALGVGLALRRRSRTD